MARIINSVLFATCRYSGSYCESLLPTFEKQSENARSGQEAPGKG